MRSVGSNAVIQRSLDRPGRLHPDADQARVLELERGAMLVTGRPGTGKTAVLVERFVRLIEGGGDPERIGLVVRTRRARQAARAAVLERLPTSLPGLRVMTVHGLAHHVVSANHRELGYELPPEVLTASDQFAKVRELLQGERPGDWPAYGALLPLRGFADQVRQFVLRAQESLLSPDDVQERASRRGLTGWLDLSRFFARYLRVLDDEGVVDFAGLVHQAARAAEMGDPLFDHLLVDDYQDATLATERLIVGLRPESLVVAGDPRAHVFSFQGTTDAPIRSFLRAVPSAVHVELATAHRARNAAVAVEAWHTAHSSDEHAAVARELRRVHVQEGVPWRDLAVVVRRQGGHLAGLLRALDDGGVPRALPERALSLAVEAATSPFILAFRWLAHPHEREALVEPMLTSDLVGLSPAAARGLVRAASAAGEPRVAAMQRSDGLTSPEAVALAALDRALGRALAVAGTSATDAFRTIWSALPFSQRLVAAGDASARGRRDLDAVVALSRAVSHAADRGGVSVADFLDVLDAGEEGPGFGDGVADDGEDAVRVFTAHGVTGQEFDTVIVTGVVEGDFPSLSRPEPMFDLAALEAPVSQSDRNRLRLEDERRLFSVVTSRARRRVVLTASDPHQDEHATAVSRFAAEAGARWEPAPAGPADEPLTVGEAAATWRRSLADVDAPSARRLASLDGLLALGQDPSRWWFQRDWTGTERPLHEHIRVSNSKLEKLENCELQFVLGQELGLEGAAGYHAWVGSLVHGLIEACENGAIERSLPALVEAAEAGWQPNRFPSRAVSEAFRRLVVGAMLPAWFRDYGEPAAAALAREIGFEFDFDGASVRGFIDRIGPAQGGGSSITDYKTGRSRNAGPADDSLQLGIYFLAVDRAEGLEAFRPVKGIELVFLRDVDWRTGAIARQSKGFSPREQSEFRDAVETRLSQLIERVRTLLRTETYRPNPSANCRFCDFKTLCPLWPEGKEVFPVA